MKYSIILYLIFPFISIVNAGDETLIHISSVKTEYGFVSGTAGADLTVKVFKGIPFAAPPVGELRWKEPQPPAKWEEIKKCDTFAPSAMQGAPVPFGVYTEDFLIPEKPISEDCLYLNIWTTASSTKDKLPVLVFIHGGGFVAGSGSVPIYDGESMAKKGIVFVTINYRLGVFGFLAHPELTKESPHNASGNYGIMDQVQALKWIKNNIRNFGGDPENITIAGQSAGAMSVNVLSASPLTKGLFQKMIAESGGFVVANMDRKSVNLEQAELSGLRFAESIKAASIKDLRNIPAADLLKTAKDMPPVIVDGYVLPEPVHQIYSKGLQADVPVLTGWNGDDVLWSRPVTKESFLSEIKKEYGEDAGIVLKFYPANNDEEAAASDAAMMRDRYFGIQNYAWARIQGGKQNSYLYYFTRKVPAPAELSKYGAFHSGEITYAYDNLRFQPYRPFEDADRQLSRLMSSYWANFIKTGNPNGNALPEWPAFDYTKGEVMIFDITSHSVQHPNYEVLEYFYNSTK